MGYEQIEDLIQGKRTLEILDLVASDGPLNYTEIESNVDTSSDIVTDRLDILVEYDLLRREEFSSRDVQYEVTEKGREFLNRLDDLNSFLICS